MFKNIITCFCSVVFFTIGLFSCDFFPDDISIEEIPVFGPQHGINVFRTPEKIYDETVFNVVSALDNGDKTALKEMFVDKTRNLPDFDEKIDYLFSLYNVKHSKIGDYTLSRGSGSIRYGVKICSEQSIFPIMLNDEYYYIYINVSCIDESNPENEGITSFGFYSAQDHYLNIEKEIDIPRPEFDVIISTDHADEFEYIVVGERPYKIISDTAPLSKIDVLDFLSETNSSKLFVDRFGAPIAEDDLGKYYYIDDGSQETHYLYIADWVEKEEIRFAKIESDLKWIEKIYDKDED